MKWLLASPSQTSDVGSIPIARSLMQLALLASHPPFSLYHAVFGRSWT